MWSLDTPEKFQAANIFRTHLRQRNQKFESSIPGRLLDAVQPGPMNTAGITVDSLLERQRADQATVCQASDHDDKRQGVYPFYCFGTWLGRCSLNESRITWIPLLEVEWLCLLRQFLHVWEALHPVSNSGLCSMPLKHYLSPQLLCRIVQVPLLMYLP
jgi:hypothetical protein